jgi:hypothetical protein
LAWGDDNKRIVSKLRVQPADVLDLNHVFHRDGWRKDMGVKGAVAVLFNPPLHQVQKSRHLQLGQPASERSAAGVCRQRCVCGRACV